MFTCHSEETLVVSFWGVFLFFFFFLFAILFFPLLFFPTREGSASRLQTCPITCKSHSCRTVKVSVSFLFFSPHQVFFFCVKVDIRATQFCHRATSQEGRRGSGSTCQAFWLQN